ncbi:MAG: hypothetical protein LBG25_03920, partial [Spirochaetaceae bacterium]|nr:hypothetical protein [Spirochaetaceae bacterium]
MYDPTTDDFLSTDYTVEYLLTGVGPSSGRLYVVSTQGGGGTNLRSTIPLGAWITASGNITDTVDHTLTVNGKLLANNATFKDITKLTVSGQTITETPLARTGLPWNNVPERLAAYGWLGADSATLESAASITIGDNGEFESESPDITLPEGAEIFLGKGAEFIVDNSLVGPAVIAAEFDKLKTLYIGPGAAFDVSSKDLTLAALENLTIKDSGSLETNNLGKVAYATELKPVLGRKVKYNVRLNPTATVATTIAGADVELINSTITVSPAHTFTVAAGAKLTLGEGSTLDLMKNYSGALPSAPPITISGTIVVDAGATLLGPDPAIFTTGPEDSSKLSAFTETGKALLNWGSTYTLGPD